MENNGYKCPIEGCGKNFRKENLAQMHIKHYHPEYTKFVGTTPNVADLAYARTIGKPIDDIIPKTKLPVAAEREKGYKSEYSTKQKIKTLPAKAPTKNEDSSQDSINSLPPPPVTKDSEIIKLLNSEPKLNQVPSLFDTPPENELFKNDSYSPTEQTNFEDLIQRDEYPVIKLEDLLQKSAPIPIRKDENRTGGIKTLLPVIRNKELKTSEAETETDSTKSTLKSNKKKYRKRMSVDYSTKRRRKLNIKYDSDDLSNESSDTLKMFDKSKSTQNRNSSESEYGKKQKFSYKDDSEVTDIDSQSQDSFSNKVTEIVTSHESPKIIIEEGQVIRLVHMRSEEIINCTCGITEEDGLMIQCELCLCWQHGHCHNIQKESQVPDKYICVICKTPKNMRPSHKYIHDQDWIKVGALAVGKYHSKDKDKCKDTFEKLRQTHEITGCLQETKEYLHSLKVKLSIAENKNHQKLYLWARPWTKERPEGSLHLDSDQQIYKNEEIEQGASNNFSNSEHNYLKYNPFKHLVAKHLESNAGNIQSVLAMSKDKKIESEKELLSILEGGDDQMMSLSQIELNKFIDCNYPGKVPSKHSDLVIKKENDFCKINNGISDSGPLDADLANEFGSLTQISAAVHIIDNVILPTQEPVFNIPEPEEAIEPSDCQVNLLQHVEHYQNLMEERLNNLEAALVDMERQGISPGAVDTPENNTAQTFQMLMRDLELLRNLANVGHRD